MPTRVLTLFKSVIDIIWLTALFIAQVMLTNTDWRYVLTIVISSLAGAAILSYFRNQNLTPKEILVKALCASICGVVVGLLLEQYLGIESQPNLIGLYFLTSLTSIFLIKALLDVTEKDAKGFIITILQKFLPQPTAPYNVTPSQDIHKSQTPQVLETKIVVEQDGETIGEAETTLEVKEDGKN